MFYESSGHLQIFLTSVPMLQAAKCPIVKHSGILKIVNHSLRENSPVWQTPPIFPDASSRKSSTHEEYTPVRVVTNRSFKPVC